MKIFSDDARAAIEEGSATSASAIEILCDPPVRVWSGYEPREIDGVVHQPIGDAGLVKSTGASLGGADQGITLELSGVEPASLALFDASMLRRAPVIVRRAIFDSSATRMLDVQPFARGSIDQVPVEDTAGGTSVIRAMVETAARGLGRRGGRMRTDADQRLISPTDGGMRKISYAGQVNLYWGGKKPANASAALPGSGSAAGVSIVNQA